MRPRTRTIIQECGCQHAKAGCVSRYINGLLPLHADRVLTRTFGPVGGGVWGCELPSLMGSPNRCGCLMMTAMDVASWGDVVRATMPERQWPGLQYEALCWRFGVERVNNAIRNRILTNRARRELEQPVLQEVTA